MWTCSYRFVFGRWLQPGSTVVPATVELRAAVFCVSNCTKGYNALCSWFDIRAVAETRQRSCACDWDSAASAHVRQYADRAGRQADLSL